MKHIAKKTLSLFLALCLMAAFATTALAAEGNVRETNFFPHDLYHADLDYSEIEYKRIEIEPILEKIETIRKLLDDPANAGEVERLFWEVDGYMAEQVTMRYLLTIRTYMDVDDEETDAAASYHDQQWDILDDAMSALARDILKSPCAAFLEDALDEAQRETYLGYGEPDPNLAALEARERELVSAYGSMSLAEYTTEYNDEEWDLNGMIEAVLAGEIGQEDIDPIMLGIYINKNKALGKLYLEMIEVRNEIARANGYDSYPAYAYKETHHRDYTPEEASVLYAGIKEYIVPIYKKIKALDTANETEHRDFFNQDYVGGGEDVLDRVEPYIGQISGEMLEAFTYMREHHLYDTAHSDAKLTTAFVAPLAVYGAPFFFQKPYDHLKDYSGTTVHEFGHYNNAYYNDYDENSHYISAYDDCTDTSEVHSQAFELLFTHFYPELFGENAGVAEIYLHYTKLDSIISGAMNDEFEQYAYNTENVTLKQLNEKYYELSLEYGFSTARSQDGEQYDWVDRSHPFNSPCYIISYATSAAGAYAFWDAAQSDYFGAVDKYLQFAALDPKLIFQGSFEAVGMTNPLSEGYMKELSGILYEKLGVLEETDDEVNPFEDVDEDSPYYDAILWAVENGITDGTTDTTFSPDDPCTQAQIITFLWRAMDKPAPASEGTPFPDVDEAYYDAIRWAAETGVTEGAGEAGFDPDAPCTRAQSVSFQWRAAGQPEAAASAGFDDVDASGDYAAAVAWAVENGVTDGTGDTTFSPDMTCTRAQIVTFLYRDLG